jgi:hypothetical protein
MDIAEPIIAFSLVLLFCLGVPYLVMKFAEFPDKRFLKSSQNYKLVEERGLIPTDNPPPMPTVKPPRNKQQSCTCDKVCPLHDLKGLRPPDNPPPMPNIPSPKEDKERE